MDEFVTDGLCHPAGAAPSGLSILLVSVYAGADVWAFLTDQPRQDPDCRGGGAGGRDRTSRPPLQCRPGPVDGRD